MFLFLTRCFGRFCFFFYLFVCLLFFLWGGGLFCFFFLLFPRWPGLQFSDEPIRCLSRTNQILIYPSPWKSWPFSMNNKEIGIETKSKTKLDESLALFYEKDVCLFNPTSALFIKLKVSKCLTYFVRKGVIRGRKCRQQTNFKFPVMIDWLIDLTSSQLTQAYLILIG